MDINLWVSTDETANWLAENTILNDLEFNVKELVESDANKPKQFHRIPEAIKRILYLDAVDIIIEVNKKPVLAVEISHEAGTGHNAFQRFARLVAAAEYNIPVAYIYPEAGFIHRATSDRWDAINPTVFRALEKVMQIHNSPALLYYYPSEFDGNYTNAPSSSSKGLIHDDYYLSLPDSKDSEMQEFFQFVNIILERIIDNERELLLINNPLISKRRDWMQEQFILKGGNDKVWSPNTSTIKVSTSSLIKLLTKYSGRNYDFGDLLLSREDTLIYMVNANLRGDPYPGALSALDYLNTRIGENIEDRCMNLVMAWCSLEYDEENDELNIIEGKSSINDFMKSVNQVRDRNKCLLSYDDYNDLSSKKYNIPRYYMQVNHSCRFTKKKELRVYSVFADALLFKDGCLWKDG